MTTSTLFSCLLLVMVSMAASAQTSGSASGTLTINGKAIKLNHAHAQDAKDPFKGTPLIRVVLSDVPVSDETMEDETGVADLIQAGKLNAIEFSMAPDGTPVGGNLVSGMQSGAFTSFHFEKKVFDGKTAAGKVTTEPPKFEELKYTCTATFSAPVQHAAKPTAEGAAAAASAPGKVVIEFMRAAHAGDAAALKKVSGPVYLPQLEGPDAKAYVKSLANWLKPGLSVVRVYEWTTFARVDLAMKDGSELTPFTLTKINGEWKAK